MSKILKTLRDLFSFVFIAVFSFIITIIITLFINKSRTSELEKYTNQIKNDDVIKSISKNMQNIALSNNKHSNKNIFLSNSFSVLSSQR